jgi:hypothetical protein
MKRIVAALAALVLASSAQAQLVQQDSRFGAGTHLYDSATGLTWLRLDQSAGLTEEDWIGASEHSAWNPDHQPEPGEREWTFHGGAYSGYSVATSGEVSAMVMRAFGCSTLTCGGFRWSDGLWPTDPVVTARAFELINLFGGSIRATADGGLRGFMTGTVLEHGGPFGAPLNDIWIEARWGQGGTFTASDRYGTPGDFTYLLAPVPEPSTYALMLVGLAGLMLVSHRRRST